MPYWQLFYHITWATKNRLPLITPENESLIYDYLRIKAIGLEATVFALNGVADHVHLVAAIPPKIAIANFIGKIKAVAATKHNKRFPNSQPLYWQDEYGVFSFDHKRLPNFVSYVERQKEHHAQNHLIPVLERLAENAVQRVQENPSVYQVETADWWHEMATMD